MKKKDVTVLIDGLKKLAADIDDIVSALEGM